VRFIPVQLLICILIFCSHAAESVATYSRYCALCGIWGADSFVSESGQFIVHAYPGFAFEDRSALTNAAIIRLEPQLLAVAAERTKRIFLQEIAENDAYRGKWHLVILDRFRGQEAVTLVSHVHPDGFEYQMGIPRQVEYSRLVKGLVKGLLLEYANRSSHRNAELPGWLVEGMTQQVLSSLTPTYLNDRKTLSYEVRGYDRLLRARTFFATNSGLTINELSFTDLNAGQFDAIQTRRYQSSAQLLVQELLRLPNGAQMMRKFIQDLPFSLNWQKSFFQAYRSQFQTPLELEKWWTLVWVDFQSKREHQQWPLALSLEKLQATLLTSLEHRLEPNSLPERREATLQQVLTDTDFTLQKAVLEQKLQQLFFLTFNLFPEAGSLAVGYQQAMKSYLEQRSASDYQPGLKTDPEVRNETLVRNTIKELNRLDALMADLKSGKTVPVAKDSRNSRQARR